MKPIAWIIAGLGLVLLVVAIAVLRDFPATLGGSALLGFSALISRGQSVVRFPVMSRPVASRPVSADRAQTERKSA